MTADGLCEALQGVQRLSKTVSVSGTETAFFNRFML